MGGGGGGVRTLSIENFKFNGKMGALESWQIIVSLPILLDLIAYLPIDILIQEFIQFSCVNINFI